MSSKSPQKRVRFEETPTVRLFAPEEEQGPSKRGRLDPMEALEGEIMGVCLADSSSGAGREAAASRRAARRHHLLAGFDEEGGPGATFLGDVRHAEAEYEDPEEMFNDAGVPWEPFHLKREREEGFFDEDGNYVEYKEEEVEDAWVDQLAHVEVDEQWLARVMAGPRRRAAEALAAGEEPDPGPGAAAAHKRSLVDLLLPGENVLQALRRLAAVRTTHAAAGASGRASPVAADPLARHPRALSSQAMPPAVREKFERLTGLSSVLMEQGVYSVHSMSREQLERSIMREEEEQQAQQALRGGQPTNGSSLALPVVAVPSSSASNGTGTGDAAERLAEQLLAAAAPAADGTHNGSSTPSGGGVSVASDPALAGAPADADQDIFGDEPEGTAALGGPSGSAAGAAGVSPAGDGSSKAAAAPQGPGPAGGGSSEDVAMQDPQQQPAGAPQQPGSGVAAAAAGMAAAAAGAVARGAGPADGQAQELDGFTRDPSSGLWYNSALGCYYDAARGLFGDSASGLWYSYDAATGQYKLAG